MSDARLSRARPERGAVTTLVAVLLTTGVIFGFLSITVDMGQLLYERGQQQNSADASAYSLARSCASRVATCAPGANSLSTVNNANSYDDLNAFQSQCGENLPTGAALKSCAATGIVSTGAWADCSPSLPASVAGITGLPYVEVRTKSQSSSGGFIKNIFTQLSGGKATSTVGACSRAAWGSAVPPTGTIPIAMSACAWSLATGWPSTFSYQRSPPYTASNPMPGPARAVTIYTKSPSSAPFPTCPTSPGGGAAPGNFNALPDTGGCSVSASAFSTSADGRLWVADSAGNDNPCKNDSPGWSSLLGTRVFVPVYDCINATVGVYATPCPGDAAGNGADYRIFAYASFYLVSYNFSGDSASLPGYSVCDSGSARCVSGWFMQEVITGGTLAPPPPGGPANLGVTTIVSAG